MSACRACSDPLVLQLDPEESDGDTATVPDDLLLPCGCHFHWQCMLDQSPQIASTLSCPSCHSRLASSAPGSSSAGASLQQQAGAILARYTNEGGTEDGLDILPTVTEEAYLAAHPAARPARAMHVMCAEGDSAGIVELLRDVDENAEAEEGGVDAGSLLRYQDPLNGMRSGLHVAVENGQEGVMWLFLWLGSTLPTSSFPAAALQTAQSIGLQRGVVGPGREDVRLLRDSQGRTAADIGSQLGGQWRRFWESGLLTA
ncbi:hypothetical protein VTK73DRAFT_9227 [Phialemonium thermophilum]|uniref:RING-type domain-containing protein n=1 Tax=Phialemonium thermophilum TaxID=223376 RepID=A0ABR3W3Y7_9PEZI